MKRLAVFVAQRMFRDEEYLVPRQMFDAADISCRVFSSVKGTLHGKLGAEIESDALIDDFKADDFDAVFFVGGGGAQEYVDHPVIHRVIQEMDRQKKIISAICMSPLILGSAGLLRGRRATVFPGDRDKLTAMGVNVSDDPVVRDGRLLTGNGPDAAEAFARTLITMLEE